MSDTIAQHLQFLLLHDLVLPKRLPNARFLTLTTLLRKLAPVFLTKLNSLFLPPGVVVVALVSSGGLADWGAGLAARETVALGVASDWLKLLVLDSIGSNCLQDFNMSLSLPNVETTRIILPGVFSGSVVLVFLSSVRSI